MNNISYPDTVNALVAFYFAIQAYHGNWKAAPYSREFWLFEARKCYGLYRRLGGTSRFNEIIKHQ